MISVLAIANWVGPRRLACCTALFGRGAWNRVSENGSVDGRQAFFRSIVLTHAHVGPTMRGRRRWHLRCGPRLRDNLSARGVGRAPALRNLQDHPSHHHFEVTGVPRQRSVARPVNGRAGTTAPTLYRAAGIGIQERSGHGACLISTLGVPTW